MDLIFKFRFDLENTKMRIDYTCECQGVTGTCGHQGKVYQGAEVVIEVPLSDGNYIYINGFYGQQGYVTVELQGTEYRFYLDEFEENIQGWIEDDSEEERSKYFRARRCWTYDEEADARYHHSLKCYTNGSRLRCLVNCFEDDIITDFTEEDLKKCVRVDQDMVIPTEKEKVERKIAELKQEMNNIQKQLNRLEQKLTTLE